MFVDFHVVSALRLALVCSISMLVDHSRFAPMHFFSDEMIHDTMGLLVCHACFFNPVEYNCHA